MDRYRTMRLVGLALIAAGIGLLAWAALEGQVSFALVFVIPVLYGTGPLAVLAFVTVLAGMMIMFLSFFRASARMDTMDVPETAKREWGGVILIGPIPIVIGSVGMLKDQKALIALAMMGAIVLTLFLLILLR